MYQFDKSSNCLFIILFLDNIFIILFNDNFVLSNTYAYFINIGFKKYFVWFLNNNEKCKFLSFSFNNKLKKPYKKGKLYKFQY